MPVTPAAPLALPPDEAHVWLARTAACCTPVRLAAYRALLTRDEIERLDRYAFEHLRQEFLLTRALCRLTLSRYAAVAPQDWRFRANEYGRPEIAAPAAAAGLRFNLSNARGLVACIVAREADVGIDVEEIGRSGDLLEIARNHFAPAELAGLRRLPAAQQAARFFDLWTLKEAYIKARGMGLAIPLEQFHFVLDDAPPIRIGFAPQLADDAGDWQFARLPAGERHALAVAVRRGARADLRLRVAETVPLADPAAAAACALPQT